MDHIIKPKTVALNISFSELGPAHAVDYFVSHVTIHEVAAVLDLISPVAVLGRGILQVCRCTGAFRQDCPRGRPSVLDLLICGLNGTAICADWF